MREEARRLLHEAIAAHGVAATARRLGVARASLSLVYHDKYPGPHGGTHPARAGQPLPGLRRPLGAGHMRRAARGPHAHIQPLRAPPVAGVPELPKFHGGNDMLS